MCYSNRYRGHWGGHHRHHAKMMWKQKFAQAWGYPPVNVKEDDAHYEIKLFAAGYDREDFQLRLKDNLLTIAVDKAEETNQEERNWRHPGFTPGSFTKRFELNDKIDKESISASYSEGVLTVTLPKLEGFETFRQDIEVQ